MDVKKLKSLAIRKLCIFCHQAVGDEKKYGPVYSHEGIITHHHCMFLSPNLVQNGDTTEGLQGFLLEDILKEAKRAARLTCTYCQKKGASLGCVERKCSVKFHLPCGLKNRSMHQFFGQYQSFCEKHRPTQDITPEALKRLSNDWNCSICFENCNLKATNEILWAPCCKAFFHFDCIQSLALNAGYFFRCPLCNDKEKFVKEVERFGVYIPLQDAAWEQVPSAYEELTQRHNTCDSKICMCPTGRNTDSEGTKWELVLCKYCGSQGAHIKCESLNSKCPDFACAICSKS